MPSLIALADLSVVFIRADISKAGCSPTKLAELFACNVPVIANTGVGDMDAIIDPHRNGSVIVKDFSDESLRVGCRAGACGQTRRSGSTFATTAANLHWKRALHATQRCIGNCWVIKCRGEIVLNVVILEWWPRCCCGHSCPAGAPGAACHVGGQCL